MAETSTDSRERGRPQTRPDDETRSLIYQAARHAFAENGVAGTSMELVARSAGVSTKTLYRLVPSKAALFEEMVADRLSRLLTDINLQVADHVDIEQALHDALMACADLALDADVVAMQRVVLQDTKKQSAIADGFYRNGMLRTAEALAGWLRGQQRRGAIALDDADEAAGMLIGMLISAPQRATIFGGLPLPTRPEIEARARRCARLFLRGCQTLKTR